MRTNQRARKYQLKKGFSADLKTRLIKIKIEE